MYVPKRNITRLKIQNLSYFLHGSNNEDSPIFFMLIAHLAIQIRKKFRFLEINQNLFHVKRIPASYYHRISQGKHYPPDFLFLSVYSVNLTPLGY